jgi:hypothetical protein
VAAFRGFGWTTVRLPRILTGPVLNPTLFILRVVLCICFAAGATAADRKERAREPLPKPPPQPVAQSVKVARGESIAILLKIYGTQGEKLRFLIRRPPNAGKLSKPAPRDRESATVRYQSPSDLEITEDTFTYAVQNSAGVSAAVEVAIEIVDEPPMLKLPDSVEFPSTLAGQTAVKEIEIENAGGGMAEGEMEVDAPWKIEGPADYRLGAGESRSVTLTFAPEMGGAPRGEMRFTSDRTRTVALRGEAMAPIEVMPASVRLMPQPGTPVRVGVVTLTNNTGEPRKLEFASNERLSLQRELELAPNGHTTLTVATAATAVGAISETLEGRSGDALLRIPVSGPPAAAVLQAAATEIRFGLGDEAALVPVRNIGGAEGYWKWQAEPPFVPAEPDFRLAPGEHKDLKVRLTAGASGNFRTLLRLVGEGHTVNIAAEASLLAPTPSRANLAQAPVKKVSNAAGKKVRARDSERREAGEPVPASHIPPRVRIDHVDRNRAVLSWNAKPGAKYRVEERTVAIATGNRAIEARWGEFQGVVFREDAGRAIAELNGLSAGKLYLLRVVDVERPNWESPAIHLATPPASRWPLFTWRRMILMGLLAGLGVLLWLRFGRR